MNGNNEWLKDQPKESGWQVEDGKNSLKSSSKRLLDCPLDKLARALVFLEVWLNFGYCSWYVRTQGWEGWGC